MGPVQKAGGQAVMLAGDHPVPDGGGHRRILANGVLGEVVEDRGLQSLLEVLAAAGQTSDLAVGGVRHAAVEIAAAMAGEIRAVVLLRQQGKQFFQGFNSDLLNHPQDSFLCEPFGSQNDDFNTLG